MVDDGDGLLALWALQAWRLRFQGHGCDSWDADAVLAAFASKVKANLGLLACQPEVHEDFRWGRAYASLRDGSGGQPSPAFMSEGW